MKRPSEVTTNVQIVLVLADIELLPSSM